MRTAAVSVRPQIMACDSRTTDRINTNLVYSFPVANMKGVEV